MHAFNLTSTIGLCVDFSSFLSFLLNAFNDVQYVVMLQYLDFLMCHTVCYVSLVKFIEVNFFVFEQHPWMKIITS